MSREHRSAGLRARIERVLRDARVSRETLRAVTDELEAGGSDSALAGALETLAGIVVERERELRWHQSELEQTNAGLLALHAEIDRQRQRTAFLDDISRAAAASLDGTELLEQVASLIRGREFAERTREWTVTERRLDCPAEPGSQPDATTRGAYGSRQLTTDGTGRVSVPLVAGTHVLGVLDLYRDAAEFDGEDIALVRGIANRAAVGLRNAREYEREHELAQRLQWAMLPTLARTGGLDIIARYRSATRGVHVGGDWYDAISRPDGTVVLTVGDVTGHGLDAAIVMGQLQNALRAYALEGHGPATALRLVHMMLRDWPTSLYATAIVAEIDTAGGMLRWASAGHPPPLLRRDRDGVTYLESEHAPMLGISWEPPIPEHEHKLSPGDSIALYTDGLIERRTSDLDAGMERLAEVVAASDAHCLDVQAEQVLNAMLDEGDHDDDVCLLLCRWEGPEAH